ncbi:transposase [candidate division WOR-3 bacterium]|uniref:Transposase n=1 Tax=candidate division WOR-3 bacterium TaxID=2052148 RepID=A0A938BU77_UNCW3|nr:transposase [candidate division WOR-3 bacterium]
MSRIARVVAVGLPHHVTQRGNNRSQVFFDDDDRRFYLWTLAQYRRKYGVDIWGYCLMDNHVHALAVPHEPESLARCFAGTNLVYTQHVNRKQHRSGRLWQNRFYSCPVSKDEYLWPVLRYIDRNPVRTQTERLAWDYRWSSARHHVTGEADPLLNEPDWLSEELQQRKYRSYLRDEPEETAEEIRRTTMTGRPLGGNAFLSTLESRLDRVLGVQKRGRPRKDDGK